MTDAKPPRRRRATSKDAPRLRQGVMKRGNTWSYVIRVKDPETGVSKPRWVGGFPFHDRKRPLSWEPPIGIEPMTYALREARSPAARPLPA